MIRGHSPDEMCALCDEYSVKQADSAQAALGMGLCGVSEPGKARVHVAWDCRVCVSFRLDHKNLAARRQYVQVQKLNRQQGC